jgi:uncharacterized membrane protein SirB2
MNASANTLRTTLPTSALFTVLAGGAIAGTLDIAFAFTFAGMHGASPLRVLQFIASGLLGMDSFTYGWWSGALGAVCHYTILTVATSLYLMASRRLATLARHPFICGPLFGVAIYLVMNFIIVPLSAVQRGGHTLEGVVGDLASHLFFVGLPIALLVRRHWLARGTAE